MSLDKAYDPEHQLFSWVTYQSSDGTPWADAFSLGQRDGADCPNAWPGKKHDFRCLEESFHYRRGVYSAQLGPTAGRAVFPPDDYDPKAELLGWVVGAQSDYHTYHAYTQGWWDGKGSPDAWPGKTHADINTLGLRLQYRRGVYKAQMEAKKMREMKAAATTPETPTRTKRQRLDELKEEVARLEAEVISYDKEAVRKALLAAEGSYVLSLAYQESSCGNTTYACLSDDYRSTEQVRKLLLSLLE